MTKDDVKILEERTLHQGFLLVKEYHLQHKLFAGGWTERFTREIIKRQSAAAVLPYDPILDKIVLIEQFRIGGLEKTQNPWFIEIVAGLLEAGESPEELVYREAIEEAGVVLQDLLPICDYLVSPGASDEHITLFCGKVDASNAGGIHGLPEEHEDIRVSVVSSSEAFDMVRQGKIKNAVCIIALQWLQLHLDEVKTKFKD